MVRQHNGVCAACLEPPKNNKRLTVDHNHLTGKVRGLLCFQCNQAYGLVRERPSVLEGLYLYGVHHEGIEYMGIYTEPISNHDTSGDIQQLNLFSIVSTEDDLEQAA